MRTDSVKLTHDQLLALLDISEMNRNKPVFVDQFPKKDYSGYMTNARIGSMRRWRQCWRQWQVSQKGKCRRLKDL